MSPPAVVAIVSWNTRDLLRSCLETLGEDVLAGRAEVWVVDNDSVDGSAEMVEAEFGWASLIASRENLGFGRGVNAVAERTRGEWLVAANGDVALAPGALEAMLAAGRADPEAGAVVPRLVLPTGATQHSVHPFPTLGTAAFVALGLRHLLPARAEALSLAGHWQPGRPRRVDWAVGALLMVRREAFDAAGGFDREQWMYAEDVDICWRLHRAGWAIRYEPAARARHEVAASTSVAFSDRGFEEMAATYRWLRRRRGASFSRVYAVVSFAGSAARWLVLTPFAILGPRRWGPRRATARRWARLHLTGLR